MNLKDIHCHECSGQMFHRIFESCFGDIAEFFECPDCHFVLDRAAAGRPGKRQAAQRPASLRRR